MDVTGDTNSGFQAITKLMCLTEESHYMIHVVLIQEVKDRWSDYMWVFG